MTKFTLVIELENPRNCFDCPCLSVDFNYVCMATKTVLGYWDGNNLIRPDNCPLEEVDENAWRNR